MNYENHNQNPIRQGSEGKKGTFKPYRRSVLLKGERVKRYPLRPSKLIKRRLEGIVKETSIAHYKYVQFSPADRPTLNIGINFDAVR